MLAIFKNFINIKSSSRNTNKLLELVQSQYSGITFSIKFLCVSFIPAIKGIGDPKTIYYSFGKL